MGTTTNQNKPANPAPPLNALKNPEVKKAESPKYRSVYDEIAERRKREKHKIGVTSSEAREETKFHFGDEISEIIDEVKNSRDDDVKVYHPDKSRAQQSVDSGINEEDFVADFDEQTPSVSSYGDLYVDEENFDVPPIPKAPKRIGLWAAIISALSVLCVIAAGVYGVVNGYFDGLISML